MARKKHPTTTTRPAEPEDPSAEQNDEHSDEFDGFDDTITPHARAARRPAEPAARRKDASRHRTAQLEVPDEAKDSSATGAARARSSAEAERTRPERRRTAAVAPNPAWLAPTAVTLLILGLVYLVAFYLSGGTLPLPIQDWNLLVGFGVMVAGGALLMRWK